MKHKHPCPEIKTIMISVDAHNNCTTNFRWFTAAASDAQIDKGYADLEKTPKLLGKDNDEEIDEKKLKTNLASKDFK